MKSEYPPRDVPHIVLRDCRNCSIKIEVVKEEKPSFWAKVREFMEWAWSLWRGRGKAG